MKFLSFFNRARKSVFLILTLLLVASYAVHEAAGHTAGITGYSQYGCGSIEAGCHSDNPSSHTVISIWTSSTQIVAGQTYLFNLSVANPAKAGAGCDISVDNGARLLSLGRNSDLYLYDGELTHYSPQLFKGDSAVWSFKYIAPSKAGIVHIFIAGNAVNLNTIADAGDVWNLKVDTLNIVASAVTPEENATAAFQVFPNPSTTGRFTLVTSGMARPASIAVTDPVGKAVLQENLTLGNESSLDLSTLPNGTYFLSIRTRNGQSFIRSIVIDR